MAVFRIINRLPQLLPVISPENIQLGSRTVNFFSSLPGGLEKFVLPYGVVEFAVGWRFNWDGGKIEVVDEQWLFFACLFNF